MPSAAELSQKTDWAAEAESQILSIRFRSDGLTFISTPIEGGYSSAPETYYTEAGYATKAEAFQELFFKHPNLCKPYRSVKVYYEPDAWSIVPSELFEESKSSLWLDTISDVPTNELGGVTPSITISYRLPDAGHTWVLRWNKDLTSFLRRTLLPLELIPTFVPPLKALGQLSLQRNHKILALLLRPTAADMIMLHLGHMEYGNTIVYTHPISQTELVDELVFYLFTIWERLGLQGEADALEIQYPDHTEADYTSLNFPIVADELKEIMSHYVRRIDSAPYRVLSDDVL